MNLFIVVRRTRRALPTLTRVRDGLDLLQESAMRWLIADGVLVLAVGLAVLTVQVSARDWGAVESSVRRYALAVSTHNAEAALTEIAPDQRARWNGFITEQLGDHYDVRSVAVRTPSLIQRITQRVAMRPIEVTTVMDVNKDAPAGYYQPTTRVPVEIVDGRAYLAAPLLALP